MKTIFLHASEHINDIDIRETALGTIATDVETHQPTESQIVMSEKNFLYLVSSIPRCTEYNKVKDNIQRLKDKLTELNFKTTAELTMDLLLFTLNEEINRIMFEADVAEFIHKTPRIVGRINLAK